MEACDTRSCVSIVIQVRLVTWRGASSKAELSPWRNDSFHHGNLGELAEFAVHMIALLLEIDSGALSMRGKHLSRYPARS
jgi:hypothetical protein